MSVGRTYLDWNATAPLRPEARAAMVAALDAAGNPSSPHAEGRRARAVVEDAREEVAALVGAKPAEVVFTSGATEANNAVLACGWDGIVLTGIEHESVLAPARKLACDGHARVVELKAIDPRGVVEYGADLVDEAFACDGSDGGPGPFRLLSLQLANNETGVVQPLAAVAEAARAQGLKVHTDAVQAAGRIAVDFAALGVDYLSLSAHKLGGPKGVGALVVRDGARLPAFIAGGGQERRRRAGTENVPAIAGFGAAARAAADDLASMHRVAALRDRVEAEVKAVTPGAVVVGADAERLPNTTSIALPGANAETLVIALDLAGVAVSAGAACSSGKVGASHVLEAMGLEPALARAAIRVSLGCASSARDVAAFAEAWAQVTHHLSARQRAVA
ncbi:MAG TPA: cysteine desulfurase family protein [Hyphomicrobiaceae bacterium]|nr:cysteine desulfurase family protein [Hyphomicrobiaceae bacterium]